MITTNVQRHGTVLVSVTGALDEDAGAALQQALNDVTADERDLEVDLHGAMSMDADGLLHILALHRRAESLGLRVLVVGWQAPSNAQDLWIGSARACEVRTFPNDP
ncbi:hypothetical protein OG365_40315 (plasmid) [Streptomyces sp. NBC_00853]|uniref:STAS domain-containing protein n=1 Tax=Streptomyces sp. NBC_00853 TaxID=2903681 RepID=UPI002F90EAB3|nr:hypothetical protein OG365_40315 [Streptomyces sp. NBC_00853]